MHGAKGVLLDLAGRGVLLETVTRWADRVEAIRAACYERPPKLDALLIRPDGYVAWVAGPDQSDQDCEKELRRALEKWFGAPGVRMQASKQEG
jgi:hypothetical protein